MGLATGLATCFMGIFGFIFKFNLWKVSRPRADRKVKELKLCTVVVPNSRARGKPAQQENRSHLCLLRAWSSTRRCWGRQDPTAGAFSDPNSLKYPTSNGNLSLPSALPKPTPAPVAHKHRSFPHILKYLMEGYRCLENKSWII